MGVLRYLGRGVISRAGALYGVWEIIFFSLTSLVLRFRTGRSAVESVLYKQVYFTGFEAIPIISWIALILGLIIVTQALNILPRFGGEALVGEILVWVVVRELGPLFAAFIVIARSGTAIASELGTMKISRQFTALEVMGIDTGHYLIMPRVVGTAVSVFVLTFYFEVVAILGGYILAGFGKSIAFTAYMTSIFEAMGFLEVSVSLLKSLFFGLIIGAVCCRHGLLVEKSMTQIPQETTKAVIGSLWAVFVADAVVTFVFFTSPR